MNANTNMALNKEQRDEHNKVGDSRGRGDDLAVQARLGGGESTSDGYPRGWDTGENNEGVGARLENNKVGDLQGTKSGLESNLRDDEEMRGMLGRAGDQGKGELMIIELSIDKKSTEQETCSMKKEGEAKTTKDTGLLREPQLDCTNRQNVEKRDSGSVMNKNTKGQWKRMARIQSARRNQYESKD